MPSKKFLSVLAISGFIALLSVQADSLSNSVVAANDYRFILDNLRRINVMIRNYPVVENREKMNTLEKEFQYASEELYGLQYDSSHLKFLKIKMDLIELLDNISSSYIQRTETILSDASNQTFRILIDYGRGGTEHANLRKTFNPVTESRLYNIEKYHLFHDKETIERYLKNGFMLLQSAKNLYNDPEIALLKKRKFIINKSRDTIIDNYINIIKLCRDSKTCGIEIFRILNSNRLLQIVKDYGVDGSVILPIYDLRIPEDYRRDANDCIGLLHEVELKKLE